MVQKRLYSLNTKANRPFCDVVKISIITQNVNVFTIYETLFENVITILPISYQNKIKMAGKNKNA